ncbi:MAG: DUF485 domain-containing protein [Gemmatimonadetes bacterium]|nr:MAG: DUF485 domain-containing protein [Gemmatimonadota bacterium]
MPQSTSLASDERLAALAARRWRIALTLTAVMIVLYFGFIALIAYDKPLLARLVAPGLTVGILLGALVIVISWLLTYGYVRWANTTYDVELRALSAATRDAGGVR